METIEAYKSQLIDGNLFLIIECTTELVKGTAVQTHQPALLLQHVSLKLIHTNLILRTY